MSKVVIPRLPSGVTHFDALVSGGIPRGAVAVVGGPPGAGKTIFAQQFCFTAARAGERVLYFNTLSEPTAKTLLHLSQFAFFDQSLLDDQHIRYVDIGGHLYKGGLEDATRQVTAHLKECKPTVVVIDSFKVFDDLTASREDLRKFTYELAVSLMAWQATTLLLGEFGPLEVATNPLFSITDGMIILSQSPRFGGQQRAIQVVKMRGTEHRRDEYPFEITDRGIEVFATNVLIQRDSRGIDRGRLKTGVSRLDELVGVGIPNGASLLIGGNAGTGKTLLLLEFIYRGALANEKGVYFSFEETEEQLRAEAKELGWDFEREIDRGMLEIVFIPQPEVAVEKHLLMMQRLISEKTVHRVAVDSLSVFLNKVRDPEVAREAVYHMSSMVQNAGAVGFFSVDIPYGSGRISRYGVEETEVDGVILLTATEEGFERRRYLEIYKLRNSNHLTGRHNLLLGKGGLQIFPRYFASEVLNAPPPALEVNHRLSSGVRGLDALIGGGLLEKSVTLVTGSTGVGKSTLGLQFVVEGARVGEKGIFVALEEGPDQLIAQCDELGLGLRDAVAAGTIEIVYLSRQLVRANQFLSVLSERIQTGGAKRLVLDGIGHVVPEGIGAGELNQIFSGLASRFKTLGVTSVFTVEAHTAGLASPLAEGFSPVADNVLLMEYEKTRGGFVPTLTIVKTRGSTHDSAMHAIRVGRGGLTIGTTENPRGSRGAHGTTARRKPGR